MAYQTVPQGVKSKQLTVGGVVLNDRESSMVTVQPYRGKWGRVRIIHVPQYQTRNGYCDSPGKPAHEVIPYAALVLQVELLKGGELTHGSSSCLESRGWGLLITNLPSETVRFMKEARGSKSSPKRKIVDYRFMNALHKTKRR